MSEPQHTAEELKQMQALPLNLKIRLTQDRIRAWVNYYGEDGVYVSFSGGKDSTVLLDIVRKMYPDVKAVFSNTGLEYPEIQKFVRQHDNVDVITPKMKFTEVLTQYGYPLISKEVAEAIYYARKIGGGAETTRRRKSAQGLGEPYYTSEQNSPAHSDKYSTEPANSPLRSNAQNRGSGEWEDWRRGCL